MSDPKRKVGDRVFFHNRSGGGSLYREGVISQVICSEAGGVMKMCLGSIQIIARQPTYRITFEEETDSMRACITMVVTEDEILSTEAAVALRMMEAP